MLAGALLVHLKQAGKSTLQQSISLFLLFSAGRHAMTNLDCFVNMWHIKQVQCLQYFSKKHISNEILSILSLLWAEINYLGELKGYKTVKVLKIHVNNEYLFWSW